MSRQHGRARQRPGPGTRLPADGTHVLGHGHRATFVHADGNDRGGSGDGADPYQAAGRVPRVEWPHGRRGQRGRRVRSCRDHGRNRGWDRQGGDPPRPATAARDDHQREAGATPPPERGTSAPASRHAAEAPRAPPRRPATRTRPAGDRARTGTEGAPDGTPDGELCSPSMVTTTRPRVLSCSEPIACTNVAVPSCRSRSAGPITGSVVPAAATAAEIVPAHLQGPSFGLVSPFTTGATRENVDRRSGRGVPDHDPRLSAGTAETSLTNGSRSACPRPGAPRA